MSGSTLTVNGQNAMANSNSERLLDHWEEKAELEDILHSGTIAEAECRVMGMIFRRRFEPIIIQHGDTFQLTWTFTVNDWNNSTHVGTYDGELPP